MILKNLLYLIEKYNENGIFIELDNKIYWFNGKRVEHWCKSPGHGRIATINNELYYFTSVSLKYKYPSFMEDSNFVDELGFLIKDSIYYFTKTMMFANIQNEKLPQKEYKNYGHSMLVQNNFVFVFSIHHNEKYNIKFKRWSDFENNNQVVVAYGFNGIIYGFGNKHNYYIYDTILNQWSSPFYF